LLSQVVAAVVMTKVAVAVVAAIKKVLLIYALALLIA
jgi:hypothetical protein